MDGLMAGPVFQRQRRLVNLLSEQLYAPSVDYSAAATALERGFAGVMFDNELKPSKLAA